MFLIVTTPRVPVRPGLDREEYVCATGHHRSPTRARQNGIGWIIFGRKQTNSLRSEGGGRRCIVVEVRERRSGGDGP